MTSAIVTLNRSWLEHVLGCTACEQWWLTDGKGVRCIDGWALSESFEQRLEEEMPAGPADPDFSEVVDQPFCRNHGELTFAELRTRKHEAEMVCAVCGEPVEWRPTS